MENPVNVQSGAVGVAVKKGKKHPTKVTGKNATSTNKVTSVLLYNMAQ